MVWKSMRMNAIDNCDENTKYKIKYVWFFLNIEPENDENTLNWIAFYYVYCLHNMVQQTRQTSRENIFTKTRQLYIY